MLKRNLAIGFALTLIFWAHAEDAKIYSDSNGMPRCVVGKGDMDRGLLIRVSSTTDLYARDVLVHVINPVQTQRHLFGRDSLQAFTCSDWSFLNARLDESAWSPLPEGQTTYGSFELSAQVQDAISQMRKGGSTYRTEKTAAEFLSAHPIADFTVETNRALTSKYGVGFVSEIYKQWELSKPKNEAFRELIIGEANKAATQGPGFLKEMFKGRVLVHVRGLAHELNSAARYHNLENDLIAMGIEFRIVETHSMDPIPVNEQKVADVVASIMTEGKNVILMGLSKGGTEAIGALANLKAHNLLDSNRDAHMGKVEGFVGFSGVFAGSFLVDWAKKFPQWIIVKHQLAGHFEKDGFHVETFEGMKELAPGFMDSYMKAVKESLPQDVTYFNIVGVNGGNGIEDEESMNQLQNKIIRPRLSKYGANDGYIEYPGTSLGNAAVQDLYTIVTDSSHAIIDGSYEGLELANKQARWKMLGGLFSAIGQKLNEKNSR